MTNQETLTKAIEKATEGGWKPFDINPEGIIYSGRLERVIFNHDFAKALWGEEGFDYPECSQIPLETVGANGYDIEYLGEKWQYHLQQMVIAEDPIKYLGDNL